DALGRGGAPWGGAPCWQGAPGRGRRGRGGGGRTDVGDPVERPAEEVQVEQVAVGAAAQGNRGRRPGHEGCDGRRVRVAAYAQAHRPDTVSLVVREEQRALVRAWVGAPGVEGNTGDRGGFAWTGFPRHHRQAVIVFVERQPDRLRLLIELLAELQLGRR